MKKINISLFIFFQAFSLAAQPQVKVTTANINFRSTPEIKDDNKICLIPARTSLLVDYDNQFSEEWINVEYKGKTGYVYYLFLKTPESNNYSTGTEKSENHEFKYYTNSKGEKVQSPARYDTAPAGATAECNDGTYSFSKSRRGTCSHHGGVKRWL